MIDAVARADEAIESAARCMSLMGQSRHFARAPLTSGIPRLADIPRGDPHVTRYQQETHALHKSRVEKQRRVHGTYVPVEEPSTWGNRRSELPQANH